MVGWTSFYSSFCLYTVGKCALVPESYVGSTLREHDAHEVGVPKPFGPDTPSKNLFCHGNLSHPTPNMTSIYVHRCLGFNYFIYYIIMLAILS